MTVSEEGERGGDLTGREKEEKEEEVDILVTLASYKSSLHCEHDILEYNL